MDCIDNIKFYALTSDKPLYSKYQFNCLENMGNALIAPSRWSYKKYFGTDAICSKIFYAIVGIAASLLLVIGAIFKEIGECCNEHKAERHEVYNRLKAAVDEGLKMEESTGVQKLAHGAGAVYQGLMAFIKS